MDRPIYECIAYDLGNELEDLKKYKEDLEKYTDFLEEKQTEQLIIADVVSSADYKHIWKLMDELNTIMWESYMIKGKDFGRQEGYKIMGLLEQWAERH